MVETSTRDHHVFREQTCTRCGQCFVQCPELELPESIARQEIDALIAHKPTRYVLQLCSTCFSCNLFCPTDCHPYQLILENWNQEYLKRGAAAIYRFVCPTIPGNIWDLLYRLFTDQERKWVDQWMATPPKGTILLIGNYTHIFPDLLGNSRLLDFFTPVDLLDQWEVGGYLYQGGYLDVVEQIGKKCAQEYQKWHIQTIVPFLDAVHYVLTYMHPQEMHTEIIPKVVNFNSWLLDCIQSQEIRLITPVNLAVTIHDNCYSKTNGPLYWTTVRELLARIGCQIIEMPHHQETATCCGFGRGASIQKNIRIAFNILASTRKKFQEAESTGADALVTYCGGCLYLLWAAKVLFHSPIKLYHSIELVRWGMGEDISGNERQHTKRAWDVIVIITIHIIRSILSRRFFIDKISTEIPIRKTKHYLGLRIFRWILSFHPIQWFYRMLFLALMPLMTSKQKSSA